MTAIEHDLPCLRCGYNLRTQSEGGRCPECNLDVATTLAAPRIPETLLRWFPRGCWVLGLTLLLVCGLQLAGNSVTVSWLMEKYVGGWQPLRVVLFVNGTMALLALGKCAGWSMLLGGALQTPLPGMPRRLALSALVAVVLQSLLAVGIAAIDGYFEYQAMMTFSYLPPPFYTRLSSITGYGRMALMCLVAVLGAWYLWIALRAVGGRILPWAFVLVIGGVSLLELAFFALSVAYGSGVLHLTDSSLTWLVEANRYTGITLLGAESALWLTLAPRFGTWARGAAIPIVN